MAGLRYADIQRRPLAVLDLISLTVDEFTALVPSFDAAFQEHMAAWRMDGLPRTRRQWSSYANSPLPTPEDRLLFMLTYIKTYPLQVVHGRLFGMPQNKANQWIHVLLPVLQRTMQALGESPTRTRATLEAQLIQAAVPADQSPARGTPADPPTTPEAAPPFNHDGTERRIQRPQDPLEQAGWYSGKKKAHTVKNVLLADQTLRIVFLSSTVGGATHDKRVADATPYPLSEGSQVLQDLGFLGFTLEGVEIVMPTRKPRQQELTPEQQAHNTAIARRIRIEHVNSRVKRCRIVKETLRLLKAGCRD